MPKCSKQYYLWEEIHNMFSLRNFVKTGFLRAVGKMSDYQIILNAAGWNEKGVLTEDDLAEIQTAIEAQYPTENETIDIEQQEQYN